MKYLCMWGGQWGRRSRGPCANLYLAEHSQGPRHLRRLSKVAALEKTKLKAVNEKEVL